MTITLDDPGIADPALVQMFVPQFPDCIAYYGLAGTTQARILRNLVTFDESATLGGSGAVLAADGLTLKGNTSWLDMGFYLPASFTLYAAVQMVSAPTTAADGKAVIMSDYGGSTGRTTISLEGSGSIDAPGGIVYAQTRGIGSGSDTVVAQTLNHPVSLLNWQLLSWSAASNGTMRLTDHLSGAFVERQMGAPRRTQSDFTAWLGSLHGSALFTGSIKFSQAAVCSAAHAEATSNTAMAQIRRRAEAAGAAFIDPVS